MDSFMPFIIMVAKLKNITVSLLKIIFVILYLIVFVLNFCTYHTYYFLPTFNSIIFRVILTVNLKKRD